MPALEIGPALVDADACKYAFLAGQALETLLLQRGLDAVSSSREPKLSISILKDCLAEMSIEDIERQLDERLRVTFERKSASQRRGQVPS